MKLRVLILLIIFSVSAQFVFAQRGGAKIAYIDTEYILNNLEEYKLAKSQLETKVQKWKSGIEVDLNAIKQRRAALSNEKALLTKELYEERLEDLSFEEKEIIDYQQKRFGPQGDLMIQRKQLMQPVQDQIFQAIQDLAAKRKYDFVFDKSADVVMLYSAEKYDVSDQVLRILNRASNRKQANTRAEKREAEKDEDTKGEKSESQLERERILKERKAKRDSTLAVKKEQLRLEREAKIKVKKAARDNAKNANKTSGKRENADSLEKEILKTKAELLEEKRKERLAERAKRAKALQDKRKAEIEALKKQREAEKANAPN